MKQEMNLPGGAKKVGDDMKNKMIDLHNHLFAQLERLSDEDLDDEKLGLELNRTRAMTSVSIQIIDNVRLMLKAQTVIRENMIKNPPEMLGIEGYAD